MTDAPITLDLEQCSMTKFSMEGARKAFEELGFKSLLKRLETNGSKGTEETKGSKVKKEKENQQLGLL